MRIPKLFFGLSGISTHNPINATMPTAAATTTTTTHTHTHARAHAHTHTHTPCMHADTHTHARDVCMMKDRSRYARRLLKVTGALREHQSTRLKRRLIMHLCVEKCTRCRLIYHHLPLAEIDWRITAINPSTPYKTMHCHIISQTVSQHPIQRQQWSVSLFQLTVNDGK